MTLMTILVPASRFCHIFESLVSSVTLLLSSIQKSKFPEVI